jgi:hypothetical protein
LTLFGIEWDERLTMFGQPERKEMGLLWPTLSYHVGIDLERLTEEQEKQVWLAFITDDR